MFDRRKFLQVTAASLVTPAVLTERALAEAWPVREVKIVVGFEGGGATDIIARTLAERLKEMWGQAVAVENKPATSPPRWSRSRPPTATPSSSSDRARR
jgi:tripartite-type tricarboxylate transporter receptor subunit TctC